MRKFKSVLALLLALAMVLSCFGGVAAAKEKPSLIAGQKNGTSAKGKGALSVEFEKQNSYHYADDEIVRAIVVLETAPEADVAGGPEKKAAHRANLLMEHSKVRMAMEAIPYEMGYEFTALLNGFSCDIAYGDLKAIAEIDGVSAVYIANSYAAPVLEKPQNEISGLMMGNYASNRSGYNGNGIVVAVLDTGLRTTHEAFRVYSGMSLTETLTKANITKAAVSGKYISAKVPFAYDYADGDNDVSDKNGHGTHVSGTAVGYAETEDGAILMSGAAPAAQLLSMKIFQDEGQGTRSDIYYYALEDAYRLGADVVNMSIGAQNGFTYDSGLETEVFGNIYKRLEAAGIVLCVSAGNEYSMNYYSSVGYTGPEYADYGTVGAPSTYEGSVSIASVENAIYPDYVIEIGGQQIPFIDTCADGEHGWIQNFGGKSVAYIVLKSEDGSEMLTGGNGVANSDGSNAVNHYEGMDVSGKIVVVSRGDITFEEKVQFAAEAGAIGVIVCNNQADRISMSIETFEVPAVSVTMDARELFMAGEAGDTVYMPEAKTYVENPDGWMMSEFSNWGTSPMLTIDPTLTGVGGLVYSSVPTGDGDYDVYSGTSMAAPNATGTFACVLQALAEDGNRHAMDKVTRASRAKSLLESTGIILFDANNYIYSVRKQGSGLANSANAIDTYFNGAFITNPIQELGDDKEKTGVYTMELELVNEGFSDITYDNFGTYILYDNIAKNAQDIVVNTLTSSYLYVDSEGDATVSYMVNGEEVTSITLMQGEKKTVTVTITLNDEAKTMLDANYANGTYIEGYVSFSQTGDTEEGEIPTRDINADTYETHATFLAFYGDWTQGPAMESVNSFDYLYARYLLNTYDVGGGKTYDDHGYTAYDLLYALGNRWYTDLNWVYGVNSNSEPMNYLGANLLDWDTAEFMPEHVSFSTPETDGVRAYTPGMYVVPNLIRNARHIVMTVTDTKTGEVYLVDNTEYIPKDAYDYENGVWQNYSVFAWDGTKSDGKTYVPSGTVATVSFSIQLPYGEAEDIWQENVWSFDVTVDSTAPVIKDVIYDAETKTLTVTASDEQYLAGIYLAAMDYSEIYMQETFSSDVKGESFTATFDVSKLNAEAVVVTAMDYATNENEQVTCFLEDGKAATVTLVTPAGTQVIDCTTGSEIQFPEAEAYEGYRFEGWTTAHYTESNGGDIETVYPSGAALMVSEQEYTFYALYSKGEQVNYDKIHYRYKTASSFVGYWAFVGFPYVNGSGYDVNKPFAMGSNGEAISVSSISDAEIYENKLEFTTNNSSILYYLQYFADYDAYAIINAATGKVLTNVNRVISFMDKLYYEGLWKLQATEDGNILCYNYATPTDILLFNDETSKFEILDDTVANSYGYCPNQRYSLHLYGAFDSTYTVTYYTTEICLHDLGSHTFGEWVVTKAATCTEEGVKTLACTKCAYSYTEAITATGHTVVTDSAVDASCSETGLTEGSHCCVCGEILVAQETVDALGHSYTVVITAPTCTEQGYTTHTCSRCSDSYKDSYTDATGHSYSYTDKGETHDAVCSKCSHTMTEGHSYTDNTCICGAVEILAPITDENIVINHSLNLASDISINYAVKASLLSGYDRFRLEIEVPVYSGNTLTGSETVAIEPVRNGDYYYFTMEDLTAMNMNDILVATLRMYKGKQEYISKPDSYSVATYALALLNADGIEQELKVLGADLLRYGAAAQTYKDYRTDALATAAMTAAHEAYLSDLNAVTFGNTNTVSNDLPDPVITWAGKTMNLGSKVVIKFVFKAGSYTGDISQLTLRVVYQGSNGADRTATLSNPTVYNETAGMYAFEFDGLLAAELRTPLRVAVYNGDTQLSQTLKYSADTYGNSTSDTLLELCKALFAYSDSAKAYFTK